MNPFKFAPVIFLLICMSAFADVQNDNDLKNMEVIEERIQQYEQVMNRYFRNGSTTTAKKSYESAVDDYNKHVETVNNSSRQKKIEIEKKEDTLEKIKKQIEEYDARLVKNSDNRLIDQRNTLVEQYNSKRKKLEEDITRYNEWIKQKNENLDAQKQQLEKIKATAEREIKNYNDWFRLDKDEEFWADLNRTYLKLHKLKRSGDDDPQIEKHIQIIRNIRQELGNYAINQAKSEESGLVITAAIVCGEEQVHFIVDTGANYVSLTPEMVEVLGLKDRLGEVADLRLAAGKSAWGQKIMFPSISVLGKKEKDVPGIAIPEKKVGIDGLLGRSFLKRFVVCFDYEQGARMQLTPKNP